MTAKSQSSSTQYYNIPGDKPYAKFFQDDDFCGKLKLTIIEKFGVTAQIRDNANDFKDQNVAYIVELSGCSDQVVSAYNELRTLLTISMQEKVLKMDVGKIK